jgi:preprotein translocase subunit Sss1
MEPITKMNALELFHKQPDESYLAKVSNTALFDLVLVGSVGQLIKIAMLRVKNALPFSDC